MNKCIGCGAKLQTEDENQLGYIKKINEGKTELCERCFRIQNYSEYRPVDKTNKDFEPIFKKIDKSKELVLLVVDLLNLGNIEDLGKYINNDVILVLTKRDLIPRNIYEEKLLNYFNKSKLNIKDKIIISSKTNYNMDELVDMINKHKHSKKVYVMGMTNAGKSTLINKLIYNYSKLSTKLTTSILPSTTLDTVEVKIAEDLTLVDTPGLLSENSIVEKVSAETLRKITPNKEIKPTIFQIKSNQIFIVENFLRLEVEENNNIVFYLSNNLNILRLYKENDKLTNLEKHTFDLKETQDIVIEGLGFIKIMKQCNIVIYTLEGVNVYTRKSFL